MNKMELVLMALTVVSFALHALSKARHSALLEALADEVDVVEEDLKGRQS